MLDPWLGTVSWPLHMLTVRRYLLIVFPVQSADTASSRAWSIRIRFWLCSIKTPLQVCLCKKMTVQGLFDKKLKPRVLVSCRSKTDCTWKLKPNWTWCKTNTALDRKMKSVVTRRKAKLWKLQVKSSSLKHWCGPTESHGCGQFDLACYKILTT